MGYVLSLRLVQKESREEHKMASINHIVDNARENRKEREKKK